MRTSKFLGVVGAGLFALSLGVGQAGGSTMTPRVPAGISQSGLNHNVTDQSATSEATTKQKNVNVPLSLFSVGSNNGDVRQSNDADTTAKSSNRNQTSQQLGQDQSVHGSKPSKGDKPEGHKPPKDHRGDCKDGRKDHDKKHHDKKHHDKKHRDKKHHDKDRHDSDKPHGDKPHGKSSGDVSQSGRNENKTDQSASSEAETKQTNVNVPIAVFSAGSNNGDVHQSNDADTTSKSSNRNGTRQGLVQDQSVNDRWGNASQDGRNSNDTTQKASSEAETGQTNINAPISIFSVGSNNGDVRQSNDADTTAKSSNGNWTSQSADQNQKVNGGESKGRNNDSRSKDGKDSNGEVKQSGRNENKTDQSATSEAETTQKNVNVPISILSVGSNNGDVHQANQADTTSKSSNDNSTQQWLGQSQSVGGLLG